MSFKDNNNGVAPLAQPPVCALSVSDDLRSRIEEAHNTIEEEHPGGLTLQEVLKALIVCGLETIDNAYFAKTGPTFSASALQTLIASRSKRCDQKSALVFLRWWALGGGHSRTDQRTVNRWQADAIEMFAPDELQFLTVEDPLDHAVFAELRAKIHGEKPEVVERVYDDSVQNPLTASEHGAD